MKRGVIRESVAAALSLLSNEDLFMASLMGFLLILLSSCYVSFFSVHPVLDGLENVLMCLAAQALWVAFPDYRYEYDFISFIGYLLPVLLSACISVFIFVPCFIIPASIADIHLYVQIHDSCNDMDTVSGGFVE